LRSSTLAETTWGVLGGYLINGFLDVGVLGLETGWDWGRSLLWGCVFFSTTDTWAYFRRSVGMSIWISAMGSSRMFASISWRASTSSTSFARS